MRILCCALLYSQENEWVSCGLTGESHHAINHSIIYISMESPLTGGAPWSEPNQPLHLSPPVTIPPPPLHSTPSPAWLSLFSWDKKKTISGNEGLARAGCGSSRPRVTLCVDLCGTCNLGLDLVKCTTHNLTPPYLRRPLEICRPPPKPPPPALTRILWMLFFLSLTDVSNLDVPPMKIKRRPTLSQTLNSCYKIECFPIKFIIYSNGAVHLKLLLQNWIFSNKNNGFVYWGLTPQQQPGSYWGDDDDDDEMSVSLVEETGVPGGNPRPTATNQ